MEGNNLIKKGVAVAVILLFIGLAFVPSINANTEPETTDIFDRAIIWGIILFPHLGRPVYLDIKFFAICLWIMNMSPTNRTEDVYWFKWVTLIDFKHNNHLSIFQNRWIVRGFVYLDDIIIHQ